MASRLILAVAGSGKTSTVIDSINPERRTLVLTYTIANWDNLRRRIIQRFGYLPETINVQTYVSFLHGFCYRPFLQDVLKTKGVVFAEGPQYGKGIGRYISDSGYLYNNRLYKLVRDEIGVNDLLDRFNRFYHDVFIDEVQDFAGHDFDLIEDLTGINGDLLCVGDYFQYTYDTSRDGPKNKNLHRSYEEYVDRFEAKGFEVDTETLSHSYRCSPALCDTVSELGIAIQSHRVDNTDIVRVNDEDQLRDVCTSPEVVKLFYQRADKYPMRSMNWAKSKGIDDFGDVCVVLNNGTRNRWNNGTLDGLADRTKRKLYVALTRTRGTLYIADESQVKQVFEVE